MSSEWPDIQLSSIQRNLQNSWQIPYISLFGRIFCDAFQLFDFHQEELEDALLSDNPNEIHPFLQELLISLLTGLTRLHVSSSNMFTILTNVLKRCELTIVPTVPSSGLTISDDTITTTDWREMGIFEKVTVLRSLCDARLNRPDVEQLTENMSPDALRFEPFGEDSRGNKWWYFGDTRLYCDTWHKDTETSTWECTCRTLEEWNIFIDNFRKICSKKHSNSKDRKLFERLQILNADLPDIYARKERDRQRRWTSYEPKRFSTRLETKRQQRLELEEITQEQKARHDKFLEYKRRQEEIVAKEKERLERVERVKRREERAHRIRRRAAGGSLTGVDGADLSENSNTSSTLNDEINHSTDTTDIHQKVVTMLRTNENSWPFLEPVTEELAPNYFSIIEKPMDLSTIQEKITSGIYKNNSAEFVSDIELMVANCEQYNGKRSILGRLANRLLRYFKECWSECQPATPQIDDDLDDSENPLKKRLHESTSTTITRDKNNNTRPRKNYRALAGLSDDDEDDNEADYVPLPPSSKRARHSLTSIPIYITVDPNSPASSVYHDHSYFIRHEPSPAVSSLPSTDTNRRKLSLPSTTKSLPTNNNLQSQSPRPPSSYLPSVQVLNQLLLQHQQKTSKNSQSDLSVTSSSSSSSSSSSPIDFTAILRALLAKQGHHLSPVIATTEIKGEENQSDTPAPPPPPAVISQLQSDPSSTAASS